MNTSVYKSAYDSWVAETNIDIGNGQVINVFTMRRYTGNVTTTAKLCTQKDQCLEYDMLSYNTVLISQRYPRATKNIIKSQHETGLKLLPDVLKPLNITVTI